MRRWSRPAIRVACGALAACCILGACRSPGSDAPAEPKAQQPEPHPTPVPSSTVAAFDRDFPDPAVIRASNGIYYGYATQTVSNSKAVNIQLARSEDLKAWAYLGDALPEKPRWAKTTQSFWAPDIVEHDGTFYLYFSAIADDAGVDETCLAVATSDSAEGPFEDSGAPLFCGYEIDPTVFRDPVSRDWYMYWGSAGDIAVQQLSDDLMQLEGTAPTTLLQGWSSPVRRPYEHGIEGPYVVRRNGWYYLLYSGDRCCEFPPHYAVLTARSHRPDGGFRRIGAVQGRNSSVILSSFGRWSGPGHCSIVTDGSGRDWIVYHAIDSERPYLASGDVRRVMMIDRLVYRSGWPRIVRSAAI